VLLRRTVPPSCFSSLMYSCFPSLGRMKAEAPNSVPLPEPIFDTLVSFFSFSFSLSLSWWRSSPPQDGFFLLCSSLETPPWGPPIGTDGPEDFLFSRDLIPFNRLSPLPVLSRCQPLVVGESLVPSRSRFLSCRSCTTFSSRRVSVEFLRSTPPGAFRL